MRQEGCLLSNWFDNDFRRDKMFFFLKGEGPSTVRVQWLSPSEAEDLLLGICLLGGSSSSGCRICCNFQKLCQRSHRCSPYSVLQSWILFTMWSSCLSLGIWLGLCWLQYSKLSAQWSSWYFKRWALQASIMSIWRVLLISKLTSALLHSVVRWRWIKNQI